MTPVSPEPSDKGGMSTRGISVDLIPLGQVDPLAVSVAAAHIQTLTALPTDIRPRRMLPEEAFLPTRRQYDATRLIKQMAGERSGAPFKVAVMDRDLCVPILTYVYGESQLGGQVAVVSFFRLRHPDRHLGFERMAKISLHEVGHLMGLEHCRAVDCLMRFSKDLAQLDALPLQFCRACRYEVERRVAALAHTG